MNSGLRTTEILLQIEGGDGIRNVDRICERLRTLVAEVLAEDDADNYPGPDVIDLAVLTTSQGSAVLSQQEWRP